MGQSDVFDPTCVSKITLTAPQQSIDNLYVAPKGDYQPGTMTYDQCGRGTDLIGPKPITFRLKGNGSFQTLDGKAAFKIKMSSANRIDGLKSLTLNNMVQDSSSVHEAISYQAFRAVGVPAPRVGYAIVSLNGLDYGLHANVETIDDRFLDARYGKGTTQHLYEPIDWQLGPSIVDRDVLPQSVDKFQIQEGDDDTRADLTSLASISQIPDDADWWSAVQQKFNAAEAFKYWAANYYLGIADSYAPWLNNYYLRSSKDDRWEFLPWGTDESFLPGELLDPKIVRGSLALRCLRYEPCIHAYRAVRNWVAEKIISLDLVTRTRQLATLVAPAVAADSRGPSTPAQQCEAANGVIDFLVAREAEWRTEHRLTDSGIVSAQSSGRITCDASGAINGWPGGSRWVPADPGPAEPPWPAGPDGVWPPDPEAPATSPAASPETGSVSINRGQRFTRSTSVTLNLTWPPSAAVAVVSNYPDFRQSATYWSGAVIPWRLGPGDARSSERTVYVRFSGRTDLVTSASIALDDQAPVVRYARLLRGSRRGVVEAEVRANDAGSGVARAELRTGRSGGTISVALSSAGRMKIATRARPRLVRVVDAVGNASPWRSISVR